MLSERHIVNINEENDILDVNGNRKVCKRWILEVERAEITQHHIFRREGKHLASVPGCEIAPGGLGLPRSLASALIEEGGSGRTPVDKRKLFIGRESKGFIPDLSDSCLGLADGKKQKNRQAGGRD